MTQHTKEITVKISRYIRRVDVELFHAEIAEKNPIEIAWHH